MIEPLQIPYLVRCKVTGPWACFTRPEMKVERVTYDVMTPSAARGILEAVYWKPEIVWRIDRIHVLNPIQFMNIRRNEVASAIPSGPITTAIRQGAGAIALYIDDDKNRQQRASRILKDVAYVIEAHFELRNHDSSRSRSDDLAKHHHIVKRRMISGQCFHQPYFGTREFAADFSWIDSHPEIPPTKIVSSDQDLGFMLHDIDHGVIRTPKFFRARIRQGVIEVPSLNSPELLS